MAMKISPVLSSLTSKTRCRAVTWPERLRPLAGGKEDDSTCNRPTVNGVRGTATTSIQERTSKEQGLFQLLSGQSLLDIVGHPEPRADAEYRLSNTSACRRFPSAGGPGTRGGRFSSRCRRADASERSA